MNTNTTNDVIMNTNNTTKKPKRRVSFSDDNDNNNIITSKDNDNNIISSSAIDYVNMDPTDYGTMMNIEALYRENSNDKYELSKQDDSNFKLNVLNMEQDGIYQIEWIDTNQSLGIMLEEDSDAGMTLIHITGVAPGKRILENSIQVNDVLIMINDISMVSHGFSFVQQTIHNCKEAEEKIVLTFLRTTIVSLESFLLKELELEVDPKYNIPIELFINEPEKAVIPTRLLSQ